MLEDACLKCPVCQARFRAEERCSRCGADLTMLMKTAAKAFLLRQAARKAIRQGALAGFLKFMERAGQQRKDIG